MVYPFNVTKAGEMISQNSSMGQKRTGANMARSASDGAGGAKLRSTSVWSREEQLRLLSAWRDVLLQLSSRSSGSPPASQPQEALEPDEVGARTFERFMELSRGTANAPERRETSATGKRQALMRTFLQAVEYNEQQDKQQQKEQRSHTGNKRKKRLNPQQNHWFTLTAEQQQRITVQYKKRSFAEIDEEMFTILAVIDKAEQTRKECIVALRVKNVPWTKGEVWVLINAWRRVIESRPKTRDHNSNIAVLVSKQFDAQSKRGMPRRSKYSVKGKLSGLTLLYRLISEFNQQRCGPHEVDHSPDWFSSSEEVQAQYIASRCVRRHHKFSELDQDTFNAMEMIMKYEDSLEAGASRCQDRQASQSVIDISSDSENGGSDWEIVPVTSSGNERTWDESENQAIARTSHRRPLSATLHQQYVNIADLAESEDESLATTRKRAKADSEQPSASQTQVFLELLAKLKRERKVDKVKRRKERAKRKELMELISQERDERLRDREERQKEQQEWELERDQLKFKLKKMRERYKKATKRLKSVVTYLD